MMDIVFKCADDNDLYQVLVRSGLEFPRYATVDEAVGQAPPASGVLLLADDYPRAGDPITVQHIHQAKAKDLRLYVEYPESCFGVELGAPQAAEWERAVVASDFFAPNLDELTILALHGCWHLPTSGAKPHVVLARVAGYKKACYGLPERTTPLLFELEEPKVLIATTKLSQFITARYGPTYAWKCVWERILGWVSRSAIVPALNWEPTIQVRCGPTDPLPANIEARTFRRSADWFRDHIIVSTDWKKAAIEGYESIIDYQGRQFKRTWLRNDCLGESAMVMALDWVVTQNPDRRQLAGQILGYVFSAPDFLQTDPAKPTYGLVNWAEKLPVFYGDDNARSLMGAITTARLLKDDRWNEHILRCILANFRTTGPLGFRQDRFDDPASFAEGKGWKYYWDHEFVMYSPHFQAYAWAIYLWAYALTGYEELLKRTRTALHMTMAVYPKLNWANGLTQELARLLLPLSFLVRVDDSAEHRRWLMRVIDDLRDQMEPCGAIREKLGPREDGRYPPPCSNEEYGTTEASLIQEDGDAACDLLYTANFALLGLHEAAAATGDKAILALTDRLASFLCRIQVKSDRMPHLDGCWMRSFDFDLWEYWGSSADSGWGAWCVESGWTNTWIASVLAMRNLQTSLFDTSQAESFRALMPNLVQEMLNP